MERLEPTRALALKVWWAYFWRVGVGTLAVGLLAGMGLGAVTTAMGVKDPRALEGLVSLIAMPVAVAVSAEVMYRLLKKKFAGFEIALLRTP